MKYFRVIATSVFQDDAFDCVCGFEGELQKNSLIAFDYSGTYLIGKVCDIVDELDVLSGKYSAYTAIQKIDVAEYEKKRKAKVQRAMLLKELEDASKEVKLVESMKKLAGHDERMSKLMKRYEELGE